MSGEVSVYCSRLLAGWASITAVNNVAISAITVGGVTSIGACDIMA